MPGARYVVPATLNFLMARHSHLHEPVVEFDG
jgi:hypothetical protein